MASVKQIRNENQTDQLHDPEPPHALSSRQCKGVVRGGKLVALYQRQYKERLESSKLGCSKDKLITL